MVDNPAPFPETDERPYGAKIKNYIDVGVDAAAAEAKAGAESTASGALTAHKSSGDHDARYARKTITNAFTATQRVETSGPGLVIHRANGTTADKRAWVHYTEVDGVYNIIPANDAGAPVSQASGSVALGPVRYLWGQGSPVGVSAALRGSRYVDTEATNGAVEWVQTGTSSATWRVAYGDTGWRNIEALLDPDLILSAGVGAARLRRVRDQVEFVGRLQVNPAGALSGSPRSTGFKVFDIPGGFQPKDYVSHGSLSNSVSLIGHVHSMASTAYLSAQPNQALSGTASWATGSSEVYVSAKWTTANPWPGTLPGTAA